MQNLATVFRSRNKRVAASNKSANMVEIFEFRGYAIPVDLLQLTGGGTDTFEEISDLHMRQISEFTPIETRHTVFEIGCGIGRDAIPLTDISEPVISGRP